MDKMSQGLLSVRQQPVEAKSLGDSERKQICLLREPGDGQTRPGEHPSGQGQASGRLGEGERASAEAQSSWARVLP